jgi:hypothetical protein
MDTTRDEGRERAPDRNRKTLWRLVGILVIFWTLIALIFGPTYFRRLGAFWYVGDCKKQGGCWDARAGRCETDPAKCP